MPSPLFFKNLKVLELASVLAGPSVGQFFAELGADVIKVENTRNGGDVTRTWKSASENTDDRSAYFCSVNWGKKSLSLDLTTSSDINIVQKLAAKSDIVVSSFKPGDDVKLGVSYNELRKINPNLIYGRITGYGPLNNKVGYDAVLQAESGFMSLNGEDGGPPIKMPVALIDVLAGHQLKEGLLLALMRRDRESAGALVDVSLIQSAVSSLVNQASNWLVAGNLPTRKGSLHPNIAPYGEWFETSDGKKLLLAVGNDRQFRDLCTMLNINISDFGDLFTTNTSRIRNRVQLGNMLQSMISNRSYADLAEKISGFKIPAGAIQDLREVFEMPEAKDLLVSSKGMNGVRSFVAEISGVERNDELLPPPHLGEHNIEILSNL